MSVAALFGMPAVKFRGRLISLLSRIKIIKEISEVSLEFATMTGYVMSVRSWQATGLLS